MWQFEENSDSYDKVPAVASFSLKSLKQFIKNKFPFVIYITSPQSSRRNSNRNTEIVFGKETIWFHQRYRAVLGKYDGEVYGWISKIKVIK